MENSYSFSPPRQAGLLFHTGVLLILISIIVLGVWQLFRTQIGIEFFLYILMIIIATVFVPIFLYRAYSLWGAFYVLERDGIRVHWGLRVEDIPMSDVQWIYSASELREFSKKTIPLPYFRLPGMIAGLAKFTDDIPLEYMASSIKRILYIGTNQRVYAISPNDPQAFLYVYQRFAEFASITPIESRSVYPSVFISNIWRDRMARYLVLANITLNLLLLAWVSLIIPTRDEIAFGFFAERLVPSVILLVIPIINSFFILFELLLGLFYYRRANQQKVEQEISITSRRITLIAPGKLLSYLLWIFGLIASGLFFAAVYFIL